MQQHQKRKRRRARQSDRSIWAEARREQQGTGPDAGQRHRGAEQELAHQKLRRAHALKLTPLQVVQLPEHGIVERDLASDARAADRQRHQESDPGPPRQQRASQRRGNDCHDEPDAAEDDAELGEQSEPERDAEGDPPLVLHAALGGVLGSVSGPCIGERGRDPRQGEKGERPPELIEHDRLQHPTRAQKEWARQHGECRSPGGAPPAAELACQAAGQPDEQSGGERRHDADCDERVAERERRPAHQGDHRGEVHLPETQVASHRQVEQLVAMDAVRGGRIHQDMQRDHHDGEHHDDCWRRATLDAANWHPQSWQANRDRATWSCWPRTEYRHGNSNGPSVCSPDPSTDRSREAATPPPLPRPRSPPLPPRC